MSHHRLDVKSFPRYAKPCSYCERLGDPDTRCEGCGATVTRKKEPRVVFYNPSAFEPWESVEMFLGKPSEGVTLRSYHELLKRSMA